MADGVNNDFGLVARMLSDGFNRIDGSLAEIRRSLEGKADVSTVVALETTVNLFKQQVDERFRPLEEGAAVSAAYSRTKVWLGNSAVVLLAATVGAFLYYIASLGGHG